MGNNLSDVDEVVRADHGSSSDLLLSPRVPGVSPRAAGPAVELCGLRAAGRGGGADLAWGGRRVRHSG
eukprot:1592584-Pyramimonas_sp.AAC.1